MYQDDDENYWIEKVKRGLPLKDVPEAKMSEAVCLAAVQQNGNALRYVPYDRMSDALCLAAVQQNGNALKYVPEQDKSTVIEKIGVATVLKSNYDAIQHFPKNQDYEYSDILKNVEYVMITEVPNPGPEVEDARLVYSNHPKRKDKTVCVSKKCLETLLSHLPSENKQVTAAFTGHANQDSASLAGFSVNDIHQLCKKYPMITQVNLLACNTAKAQVFDKEKSMWEEVRNKKEQQSQLKGDFYTGKLSEKNTIAAIYNKIFNKPDSGGVAYVLVKEDNENSLYYAEKNESSISPQKIVLNNDQITSLQTLVNKNKPFKYPKESYQQVSIDFDSEKMQKIKQICYGRIERGSSLEPSVAYKENKKRYPYLHTHKIMLAESPENNPAFQKIEDSLLKKVVAAFVQDKTFTRPLAIKGYTKSVHVDAKTNQIEISRTHAYKGQYNSSLFSQKKSNIDYKKLDAERAKEEKESTTGEKTTGETAFKALKIKVNTPENKKV
jgi:hypothetical protein